PNRMRQPLTRPFMLTVIRLTPVILLTTALQAQHPARQSTTGPVVDYVLTVSDADTTGFDVEMHVRNARDTFRLAMAKHPAYDDRFFRYVQNLRVSSGDIVRQDSALWR